MKKPKMVILRGLPGSGKTKFAKNFIKNKPEFKRVNQEELLDMMGCPCYDNINEIELGVIDGLLCMGSSVIVDDVNYSESRIKELQCIATLNDVQSVVTLIKTPLPVCIENDKMRLSPIGSKKITSLFNNYFQRLY